MCLIALALDQSRRFPLALVAHRDDASEGTLTPMKWWPERPQQPAILGGQNTLNKGTWLGLTAQGRLAVMTPALAKTSDPQAPSRQHIVPNWLSAQTSNDRFWMHEALSGYNGFNLIAADFSQGECFWASNESQYPNRLERGIYGLANGMLNEPALNILRLKEHLHQAIQSSESIEQLSTQLFNAMQESRGCVTLVLTERMKKRLITYVFELTYSGENTHCVQFILKDWPPRYSLETQLMAETSLIGIDKQTALMTTPIMPVRKTRVRSLIRPDFLLPKRLGSQMR
jgi:uncharacterized protein with NRDE domain